MTPTVIKPLIGPSTLRVGNFTLALCVTAIAVIIIAIVTLFTRVHSAVSTNGRRGPRCRTDRLTIIIDTGHKLVRRAGLITPNDLAARCRAVGLDLHQCLALATGSGGQGCQPLAVSRARQGTGRADPCRHLRYNALR